MKRSPVSCFHPANLVTYASLGAALGAVAMAIGGSAAGAGACITVAVIADTFDGRYARRFARTAAERAFGAQLDSLSDAVAFGLAPACRTAALMPPAPTAIVEIAWWTAAFAYAAGAITRLAFYHLPETSAATFVGVPAPVAALLWASALLFEPGWAASAAIFAAIGVSMVAPVPIPRPAGIRMAAFVSWPVIVGAAHAAALIW